MLLSAGSTLKSRKAQVSHHGDLNSYVGGARHCPTEGQREGGTTEGQREGDRDRGAERRRQRQRGRKKETEIDRQRKGVAYVRSDG